MFVRGKVRNMPGLTGLRSMGRLRGRKLGCSSCGGKRLGQTDSSIYDIQYGGRRHLGLRHWRRLQRSERF